MTDTDPALAAERADGDLTAGVPATTDSPTDPTVAGGWLRRHAMDTRPLAIPAFRRQLMGQGTSYIGSMLTAVAVPVQVY